jgi:hypothetical protein
MDSRTGCLVANRTRPLRARTRRMAPSAGASNYASPAGETIPALPLIQRAKLNDIDNLKLGSAGAILTAPPRDDI